MIWLRESVRWVEEPNGRLTPYESGRLSDSIRRLCPEAGSGGVELADGVAAAITSFMDALPPDASVTVRDLERWVEHSLRTLGFAAVADVYSGRREEGDRIPSDVVFEAGEVETRIDAAMVERLLADLTELDRADARGIADAVMTSFRRLCYGRMTPGLLVELVGLECRSRGLAVVIDSEAFARAVFAGEDGGEPPASVEPRDLAAELRSRLDDGDVRVIASEGGDLAADLEVCLESVAGRVELGFEMAFFRELGLLLDRVVAALCDVARGNAPAGWENRDPEIRLRLVGVEECASRFRNARSGRQRKAFACEVQAFARKWLSRRLHDANCVVEPEHADAGAS